MPADLREYLDRVLHDLLTPIATVLIWEDILRTQAHDPVRRDEALGAIRRAAQQSSRLVHDLLDISRVIRGTSPLASEAVAIGPLVRAVLDRAQSVAAARRCAIEARVDADPWVLGDATRLGQAFERLIDHAIESASDDDTVGIVLEAAPSELTLAIRVHAPVDGDGAQHGLALGIAGELVRLHGGTVNVFDRGTSLEVRLPTLSCDDSRIT